jgi:hypothetical protein
MAVGDRVDYSFSAASAVHFGIYRVPLPPALPAAIPAPGIRVVEQDGTSGHGTLTVAADGVYSFIFYNPDDTISTPVVVSYSIYPHESWLAEWGLILMMITAAGVAVAGITVAITRRSRRKEV